MFPGRRKVIFVHGCFQAGHPECVVLCVEACRGSFHPIMPCNTRNSLQSRVLMPHFVAALSYWGPQIEKCSQIHMLSRSAPSPLQQLFGG